MTAEPSHQAAQPRLHTGFLASAARWPNRTALLLGGQQWTYAEVDRFATDIATVILSANPTPARIGIYARRSLTSYAAVIAALVAGAAFVPLNPLLPPARIRAIVKAADLDTVVTERRLLPSLKDILNDDVVAALPIVVTDDIGVAVERVVAPRTAGDDIRPPLPPRVRADDTAYMLFTSGSTGTPKGVPISHANVTSFLATNLARYAPTPDDVFSQTFEQSFDLSVFDMFMAWSAGATLCGFTSTELLAPLKIVRTRGITVWFSVPSVIAMQIKLGLLEPASLPSLRYSLFCGEPLPREYAQAWQRAAPGSIVENLYGPTELTIACTAYRWDPARSPPECHGGVVPIGRPYDGLISRVIDEQGTPASVDDTGELVVAGPQTFAAYWRNPSATEAAFVDLPNDEGEATRFYRTGDVVRRLPNDNLVFVGRRDHQVKVGGHRIELGEIETALRAQSGIVEAVAYAWPPDGAVAETVVAAVSGTEIDVDAVRTRLRALLPAYMVPTTIWIIETMPRNSSGKLDRRALAATLTDRAARPVERTAHAQ
ncbi:amino acid adenylation domain-containing protein [Bradyrhizobium sp. U87765 SZCCT0109]|nr:amino acid adenylation domain-containing protein [Bradyrhizobium sp. U87765 SZCCT0048]MBR1304872.1 amino acid adenylation domain-containing protein [Bradyrhizobium sp. U87765 SZCCT0110]MBR1320659.1 amino acid adenylation domain-containing protein [Bradyrhizobium sp. U87765 SZCCT0109]